MAIEDFNRQEKKYVITRGQYEALLKQLPVYMRPDKFGENGRYTVTSLYFENADYKIYQETKDKQTYRGKLRLRVYDQVTRDGTAFFELKFKHHKNILKRRTMLTLADAYHYLTNPREKTPQNYTTSNELVFKEIDSFCEQDNLYPQIIVSYGRHAFHDKENPDLRVTFDFNLRCRNTDLLLENGPYGKHFIDPGHMIMEVKTTNGYLPFWLEQMLKENGCEQTGFSKFCTGMELLQQDLLD